MRQPELGIKISQLRKSKGWTQEELVEKCNISVRTIQRIEAGEVSPRVYTIRTILDALDYDLSAIKEERTVFDDVLNSFRNLMLIDIDDTKPSGFLNRQLNYAWIFGIIFFVAEFFEIAAEYFRYTENQLIFNPAVYITLKATVLISYFFFIRGFILIGGIFKNYLLKIISFILIALMVFMVAYDLASFASNELISEYYLAGMSMTSGAIALLFGVAVYRLKHVVGDIAIYAGVTEMIIGFCYITVILSFLGVFLLIPAELFEIILIFKTIEIIKAKQNQPLDNIETAR